MSKHDDRKKLERSLKQFRGPLDLRPAALRAGNGRLVAVPPQDPVQAQLEELARICKKAMAGLKAQGCTDFGPPFPRGFVSVPIVDWEAMK